MLVYLPPILFVLAMGVSSLAIFLATVIRNFDAYVSVRGLLYFLLMFNSTVFYPLDVFELLPKPIYVIALYNPISHGADLMREVLQAGVLSLDRVLYLTVFSFVFLGISSMLYLRVIRE